MDFKKLKNKGYYIRIVKGAYKNKKHTQYSVVKDLKKDSKKIACYINKNASEDLVFIYSFVVKKDILETCFLNRPDSMDFDNMDKKESFKITFNN